MQATQPRYSKEEFARRFSKLPSPSPPSPSPSPSHRRQPRLAGNHQAGEPVVITILDFYVTPHILPAEP